MNSQNIIVIAVLIIQMMMKNTLLSYKTLEKIIYRINRSSLMKNNIEIYLHLFAMLIIAFFTITICIMIITLDVATFFKLFAVLVLICCLYVFTIESTYFPHIGPTLLPDISNDTNDNLSTVVLKINAPDNTKVFYWNTKNKNFHTGNYDILTSGTSYIKDNETTVNYFDNNTIIYYRILTPGQNVMSALYRQKIQV